MQKPDDGRSGDDGPSRDDGLFDASGLFVDDPPSGGDLPRDLRPNSRASRSRFTSVVLAIVAALVSGAAAFAGVSAMRGGGTPHPSAAVSPSVEAAPPGQRTSAAWDVDWGATYERPQDGSSAYSLTPPASFDDGLDPKKLPPLAPRPSPRFPVAYKTTDAIWDAVGPGWGVALYSARSYEYADSAGLEGLPASVYLVSPEGRHFHLWDFTEDGEDYGLALSAQINWVDLDLGWISVGHNVASIESEYEVTDVRDLRTGAILATGAYGEGDSQGASRHLLGKTSDGRMAWADITSTSGDAGAASTVIFHAQNSAGEDTTSTFAAPAGFMFSEISDLTAASDAVIVELNDPTDNYMFLIADLASGTTTEVHPRLPADSPAMCFAYTDVTTDSAVADCYESNSEVGRYQLDLTGDGDPVRLGPGEDPYNGDWSLPGWELIPTDEGNGRQGLDDVAGGARTPVVLPAPHATAWGRTTPARPEQFAPNLYVVAEMEQGLVLGYDRNLRTVFAICPEFWEDTQVTSALSGYALLTPGVVDSP